jgi:hypothetical protein
VVAAGAAAVGWVLATQVASVDLAVRARSGTQHVNVVSVVVTAVVVAMAGAGLLRFLERRTTHAVRTWTVIASVVWVLSLAGPLGARTVAAGLWLAALHVVVGSVVMGWVVMGWVVVGPRRRPRAA